jgi:DNA replication and repair protein RecF
VHLAHLSLTNFRNYSRLELDLGRGVTLVQGENAQGKTSLLEAMAYLATARSLLANAERELVSWLAWDEPLPFARLVGDLEGSGRKQRIEVTLMQTGASASGSPQLRKEVRINGVNRRAIDLVGQMPTVLFLPQDIELISGSPSVRRRYMDIALCQMSAAYCRELSAYNKVLQQRNALLKLLRERDGNREQLAFWNEALVEHGSVLMAQRSAFLSELEAEANLRQQALTDGRERLAIHYLASVDGLSEERGESGEQAEQQEGGWFYESSPAYLTQDQAAIAAVFRRELAERRTREIAAGASLVGPHRDDVGFSTQQRNLRTYGSRGQQRTAALAVKLAEVAVMQRTLGAPPLLLLDDVMSELDSSRRSMLLGALQGVDQAVVTTTDWEDFSPPFRAQARCLRVAEGLVTSI